jgi:Peptidase family M23
LRLTENHYYGVSLVTGFRRLFDMTRWIGLLTLCVLVFGHISAGWCLDVILPQTAYQGDLVVGKVEPLTRVWLKDKPQIVGPQGHFVIAVPRDQKKDLRVTLRSKGKTRSHTIRVWAYPWTTQKINGLPKKYVSPSAEQQNRVVSDNRKVQNIRGDHPYPVPFFIRKGFIKPVAGAVSGSFGRSRILNGKPKNPHSGVDFAAPLGHPVRCPADGIVRLVDLNMYLMGKTLMVDHGLGVRSIFIHLDDITVRTGDLVRQGDVIARVGKTGRTTGPHLHWGVSAGGIPLDPLRLIDRPFP